MLHPGDIFVGFDADRENLTQAKRNIETTVKNISKVTLHFVHSNFRFVKQELQKLCISHVTGAYADL